MTTETVHHTVNFLGSIQAAILGSIEWLDRRQLDEYGSTRGVSSLRLAHPWGLVSSHSSPGISSLHGRYLWLRFLHERSANKYTFAQTLTHAINVWSRGCRGLHVTTHICIFRELDSNAWPPCVGQFARSKKEIFSMSGTWPVGVERGSQYDLLSFVKGVERIREGRGHPGAHATFSPRRTTNRCHAVQRTTGETEFLQFAWCWF